MLNLGDFPAGATVRIPFHTFNSVGASVTISGLAVTDIEIYRSGGTTQRASDNGYSLLDTDGIDFDGLTGLHGFAIDTSDNSDAGFYAAQHDYWVAVSAITVDGQTVSFWAAVFSLDNRGLLRPGTATRTLLVDASGKVSPSDGSIAAATFAAGAITAAALAPDAGGEIADAVFDEALSGHTTGGTAGKALADILAAWTTALTESYAALGATVTPAQAFYMILQGISQFAISGTVKTTKKLDGSTTAMTHNLDSATKPTSIARAS